ncbi:DsbA family protein [Paenibacillus nasutitermitis]|uniref:Disulfide bond formation protein D n=1 Tax=Paenibacillus nasutitermitis TaxID=1652958 RepID=A0A916YUZ6_9BACL|nr:thioredoxin domain-containing protein [Paenibacillus nasutitermitis]GGD63097.1 putative disulfide bond formation protein D [Paenibacillus nasutitermitis]
MQNKSEIKLTNKARREQERKKKQKRMQIIMWTTGVCFIAIIAIAIIFQPKAKPLEVAYDQLPVMGQADAPVKIVEFGDYKCPSCKYFAEQIMPQLKADYIDTGKASLYFMNDTIIWEDSTTAALAAQAVFHQSNDEFWKYYEALFKNQQADEHAVWATPDFLTELAKSNEIKVDYDKLRTDIENQTYLDEVKQHTNFAQRDAKVTATPTLLINGVKFENVFDYAALKKAIDSAIGES